VQIHIPRGHIPENEAVGFLLLSECEASGVQSGQAAHSGRVQYPMVSCVPTMAAVVLSLISTSGSKLLSMRQ
jgi:hypothetical protein